MNQFTIKSLALSTLILSFLNWNGYQVLDEELNQEIRLGKDLVAPSESFHSPDSLPDWIYLEPTEIAKNESVKAKVDNKLYVFGGFTIDEDGKLLKLDNVDIYDVDAQTWTAGRPMPIAVNHTQAVRYKNAIWIAGGLRGARGNETSNRVQVYNIERDNWYFGPDLPVPMGSHGAALLGSKLHVFSGVQSDVQTGNQVHFYLDLDNQAAGWQNAAVLPQSKNHFSAVALRGEIYAIGGQKGHDEFFFDVKTLFKYNPGSDTWERLKDLPFTRSHFEPSTIVTKDGKILIVGGRTNSGAANTLRNVTEYDPLTDTWTDLLNIPEQSLAPVAEILNDELYVVNGGPKWYQPVKDFIKIPFERQEIKKLGFTPNLANLSLNKGDSAQQKTWLWTQSGETRFELEDLANNDWLEIVVDDSVANQAGAEIYFNIKTDSLEEGIYNALIEASAEGYASTRFFLEVKVGAESQSRVLYIHGNVDEGGFLPFQEAYVGPPYEQMLLSDNGDFGMSQFKKAVEDLGFSIDEKYDQSITLSDSLLQFYDVIILGSNQKTWSEAEKEALDRHIRRGAGLLAYSDAAFGGAWFRDPPAGLRNEQGRNSNNLLMNQFGMFFMIDQGGFTSQVRRWKVDHYLNTIGGEARSLSFRFEGPSPVRIDPEWPEKQASDSVFQIAAYQNLGQFCPDIKDPVLGDTTSDCDRDCALAAAFIGKGRVIGLQDRNTFWNNGAGTNINELDNRFFAQKLMIWLSQLETQIDIDNQITSFTLVDPESNEDIVDLEEGMQLDLGVISPQFNIRANTYPEVTGSIQFTLNGPVADTVIESIPLYTLFGDWPAGNYLPGSWEPGDYQLIGIPFSEKKGEGVPGEALTINFSIINCQTDSCLNNKNINVGGGVTEMDGLPFQSDFFFNDGKTVTNKRYAGQLTGGVYQTGRISEEDNGGFSYTIPLDTSSVYELTLYFAETWWLAPAEGKRVFDVQVENNPWLQNFDISAEAGGPGIGIVKTLSGITVADGTLDLLFTAENGTNRPILNALKIRKINELPDPLVQITNLFPNPPQDDLINLSFSKAWLPVFNYSILNQNGDVLFSATYEAGNDQKIQEVSVPLPGNLSDGVYFFKVQGDGIEEYVSQLMIGK